MIDLPGVLKEKVKCLYIDKPRRIAKSDGGTADIAGQEVRKSKNVVVESPLASGNAGWLGCKIPLTI